MKIVPGHIGRTVVTRVILAWGALSILASAGMFYVELERANRSVFEMTINESKRLTEHIDAVGPEHVGVLERQAREFLKGDFISLRIYGVDKKKILEAFDPGMEDPRRSPPEHIHDLASGELDHHHLSWVDGRLLMQVLLPVAGNDGVMRGYFEGVYAVNADTLGNIKAGMTAGLVLTLGIVLVTAYAMEMGKALRLPARQVRDLIAGAFLHDAGKIGISDTILLKAHPSLTPAEKESMRRHVSLGVGIVANSDWLRGARDIVEFHHEKFDGSGYLKGLAEHFLLADEATRG